MAAKSPRPAARNLNAVPVLILRSKSTIPTAFGAKPLAGLRPRKHFCSTRKTFFDFSSLFPFGASFCGRRPLPLISSFNQLSSRSSSRKKRGKNATPASHTSQLHSRHCSLHNGLRESGQSHKSQEQQSVFGASAVRVHRKHDFFALLLPPHHT